MKRRLIAKGEPGINLAHGLLRDYHAGCRCARCSAIIRAQHLRYRTKHRSTMAAYDGRYHEEHAERRRENNRAYRAEHAEEIAAYNRAYRAANYEKMQERLREYRKANKAAIAHRARFLRYGLDEAAFDSLLAKQGNACAICKTTEPKGNGWVVDHSHETGSVRGLLCPNCNTGIGHLRDDPDILRAAAEYLTVTP